MRYKCFMLSCALPVNIWNVSWIVYAAVLMLSLTGSDHTVGRFGFCSNEVCRDATQIAVLSLAQRPSPLLRTRCGCIIIMSSESYFHRPLLNSYESCVTRLESLDFKMFSCCTCWRLCIDDLTAPMFVLIRVELDRSPQYYRLLSVYRCQSECGVTT